VSAQRLLDTNPDPTIEEIREGLSGNLCRCAGYNRIVAAVHATATGSPSIPPPREDTAADAVAGQVDQ
jgi:aerobic-type carbon monoxide dehydrogenase small subunit (CoxS/CutS family)